MATVINHPTKLTWEEKNRGVYVNEKVDMSDWKIREEEHKQKEKENKSNQHKANNK